MNDAIPLDERIAAAFLAGARSDEVTELIGEVEAAVVASRAAAEQARVQALDPMLSAANVATARAHMDEAAFRRDRLQEAVRRLNERVRELRSQEEQALRLAAYEKVKAERDRLAEELKATYPAVAAQLADLAARVDANDREIERINLHALPSGSPRLQFTEIVARGLKNFSDGSANVPRITQQMRLPSFEYSGLEPYVWPRPQ